MHSIIQDLLAEPARIEPKYFYDAVGSRLFELITLMPEYYPTVTEQALMQLHREEIAQALGDVGTLIDLGAGNCHKARDLFTRVRPQRYIAIDISADFVESSLEELRPAFPDIAMQAIGADLTQPIHLSSEATVDPRVCFYPGSSIGNFDPAQAVALMKNMRTLAMSARDAERANGSGGAHVAEHTSTAGLLIGVDLVKDSEILRCAYNDELGITAAFNRNVLTHLNALIGSDFDIADWNHDAFFNQALSRIEMHLYAKRDVTVHWPAGDSWPAGERFFSSGESIHTENSYKYQTEMFTEMLSEAGFSSSQYWTDPKGWFAVFYAKV